MVVTGELEIPTRGRGFTDLTGDIARWVRDGGVADGLLAVHIQHTSASLLVTENADPEVLRDLERYIARLVPDGDPLFRHVDEGDDDMAAHVRSALTATSVSLPVRGRALALGTWQGVFLWEHRLRPHRRRVLLTLMGDADSVR